MKYPPVRDNAGNTPAHYWAQGGLWFLAWLGFGGCCWLHNRPIDQPLVLIKHEAPAKP